MNLKISKHLINAFAKTKEIPKEEAYNLLLSVSIFYFKYLLHNKAIDIPLIGKLEFSALQKDFPEKIVLSHKPTNNSLSQFIKQKEIPNAEMFLSPKDREAFESILKEAYVTFNKSHN